MLKIVHYVSVFLFMGCMLGDFDDNVPSPASLDENNDKGFEDFTGNKKKNAPKRAIKKVRNISKKQNRASISEEKSKLDKTGFATEITESQSFDNDEEVNSGAFTSSNKNKSISKKSGILSAELFSKIDKNPSFIRKSKNNYIFFKVKLQLDDANINGNCRIILDSSYGRARWCLEPELRDKNSKIKLTDCRWIGSSLGSIIKCNKETIQKDNSIVIWVFYSRNDYEGDNITLVFKDWNGVKEPVLVINLGDS